MRLKTLTQIAHEIRTADPESVVGESFLAALIEGNELPYTYRGNRLVADTEAVAPTLNRMLGFEETAELPQIRTIRGAVAELKRSRPEIGISEKMIRSAVKDARIASIGIGNREYIAMQSFDEPYCRRIFEPVAVLSKKETIRRGVMEQMSDVLARNPAMPIVTRVRRAG